MARREGYTSLDRSVRSRFSPQKLCQYFPERMILRWNYSYAIALAAAAGRCGGFCRCRPAGDLGRRGPPHCGRRPHGRGPARGVPGDPCDDPRVSWFGTGLGTSEEVFPAYRMPVMFTGELWNFAHSTPLEFAA